MLRNDIDRSTKEKGDIAEAKAIAWFVDAGYEVLLPLGSKRKYDFAIEKDGLISKVQVKYAGVYSKSGTCKAALRTTGGNQSFNTVKFYEKIDFDYLYIFTQKNQEYVLPWTLVSARNELSIEDIKYQKFRVNL